MMPYLTKVMVRETATSNYSLLKRKCRLKKKITKFDGNAFKIVSGRRNISMLDDEICNYFLTRVAITMNKGEELLMLLDYKLEGNANVKELTRACKISLAYWVNYARSHTCIWIMIIWIMIMIINIWIMIMIINIYGL
jgi:hypothetical protein